MDDIRQEVGLVEEADALDEQGFRRLPGAPNIKIRHADFAAQAGASLDALACSIEKLDETTALERLDQLREKIEQSYFEPGGVLAIIQRKKWFGSREFPRFGRERVGEGLSLSASFGEDLRGGGFFGLVPAGS